MRLLITDYSGDPALCDAIRRYYTLLQMTFATNVFKIFETPQSQIMRMEAIQQVALAGLPGIPNLPGLPQQIRDVQAAEVGVACAKCGNNVQVHAPFVPGLPVPPGAIPFPADNKLKCPTCGNELNLSDARRQLEAQTRKTIVSSEGNANAAI